jgi:sulfite reductase (NADPH) hemoprotein beta-component
MCNINVKTPGRERDSFARQADVDEFVSTLERYERGEIGADEWRTFRLLRGTYGQRQDDMQMLRVKIPQGVLTGDQLRALAEVGERWSRGFGHITTRQNVQFHFVKLPDVELAMQHLAAAGLTTREACGNSVRNITSCVYAGVAADEPFDVTPYAEALTRHLLRHPLGSGLPRKFKIAFEGCGADHVVLGIHDIGWQARIVDGVRGFRVTAAGGTATLCRTGQVLAEFVPARDMLRVAEAVLEVFRDHGDYKHRQRNRLKFLIKELGWERFTELFWQRFESSRAPLTFEAGELPAGEQPAGEPPAAETAPDWPHAAPPCVADIEALLAAERLHGPGVHPTRHTSRDWERWRHTNVSAQKQSGYSWVTLTVPLGDLTSAQFRVLADLAQAYGDGTVRTTADQNVVLRWVPTAELAALYDRLVAAGLGLADANTIADVTSCPGADSCKLAVTQSRGLGRLLGDFLRSRPDLVALAPDVQIKMSGCPNGCGRHHIAGIGFQGSVRKIGGEAVPQYFLMVGGGVDAGGARFGRLAAKLPARRVPQALERLLRLYAAEREAGETGTDFFARVEVERVKAEVADLERMSEDEAQPEDFIDLGETTRFAVELKEGECSA